MHKKTNETSPKLIVIYGPTVTGKTNLAIKLAKRHNGEIISADSRQIFKNLDIGTGKVDFNSKVEKHNGYWIVNGVKIHGFDIKKPEEKYSAAEFIKFAKKTLEQIRKSKKLPILVGGTGFYIKSFLYGLESAGIKENSKLRSTLSKLTALELYHRLAKLNAQKAQSLNESDKKNPRRLIRALEIEKSKPKLSTQKIEEFEGNVKVIGLTASNEYLYKKANKWLWARLDNGLVSEVEKLLQTVNYRWLLSLGLEYKWLTLFKKGKIEKEQAVKRLQGEIHAFIRRQKMWFRQFKKIEIHNISQKSAIKLIEKSIDDFIKF